VDGRLARVALPSVVAFALLGSCTGGDGAGDGANEAGGVIRFDERGGDVWAWSEDVAGTTRCDGVELSVNGGAVVAAEVSDGRFVADVPIAAGENVVTAMCSSGGSGSAELVFTGKLEPRPTARINVRLDGRTVRFDGRRSEPSAFDGAPITGHAWSVREGNPAPLDLTMTSGERTEAMAPERDGEYYVTLEVTDERGRTDRSTTYFVVERGEPRVPDMDEEAPAWISTAIVYGTVPPLFGDDGFRSVAERIPYLADLGVNALWLSPINESPVGDFGYAVKDYFELNPDYGTKDDFRHLVETAHRHGVRVLMDFVPNHISDEHPYSVDAAEHGEASHYYDFFDRDEDGQITHYFTWDNLNNMNYDNPEVRAMETEAFSYWVREFDVDGFRVDAAWGVKRRRRDYWPQWRRELKRIKPDLMLIAEASARDPYYFSNGFDVAYDWTENLGNWAWQGVFDAPEVISSWLDAALLNRPKGYHPDAVIFRFLNNNDTGTRFVDLYGEDLVYPAAALLLTLPGVPELYTGDEIGASYLPYESLVPLSWKDERGLRPYYEKLIDLRLRTPALHSLEWERVEVDAPASVYSYVRTAHEGPPVLVLLNFASPTPVDVRLDDPLAPFAGGIVRDLLTGQRFELASGSARFRMEATSALILELEER
jgi:cyclomaltodextrinase / maltogenic alpha-amylase / neopullulanase